MARRRYMDLLELKEYTGGDFVLMLDDDNLVNLSKFSVAIQGPPGTPYERAQFILDVTIPHSFPASPPKIKFMTKVFHPNISVLGIICLDVLDDAWKPGMTLLEVVEAVRSLLSLPNWESPLNIDVSGMRRRSQCLYYETAIMWARVFANGQLEGPYDKLEALARVSSHRGITDEEALLLLTETMWDFNSLI